MQNAVKTIGQLKEAFTSKTAEFLDEAKAELSVITKSKDASEKAKSSNILLGLYMAVMQDHFEFTIAPKKSPEYFVHKGDSMSYVRATLGLQKGQSFPSTAWNNAYVVFMLVVPANGKQALTEADYLALGQGDIDSLRRMTKHIVETDPTCDIRAHADVMEAVALCQGRKDGYKKALKEIENRVTGKGSSKKEEGANIVPLTPAVAAAALLEAVKHAGDLPADEGKKIALAVFAITDTLALLSGVPKNTMQEWVEEYEKSMPKELADKIAAEAAQSEADDAAAHAAAETPALEAQAA